MSFLLKIALFLSPSLLRKSRSEIWQSDISNAHELMIDKNYLVFSFLKIAISDRVRIIFIFLFSDKVFIFCNILFLGFLIFLSMGSAQLLENRYSKNHYQFDGNTVPLWPWTDPRYGILNKSFEPIGIPNLIIIDSATAIPID